MYALPWHGEDFAGGLADVQLGYACYGASISHVFSADVLPCEVTACCDSLCAEQSDGEGRPRACTLPGVFTLVALRSGTLARKTSLGSSHCPGILQAVRSPGMEASRLLFHV